MIKKRNVVLPAFALAASAALCAANYGPRKAAGSVMPEQAQAASQSSAAQVASEIHKANLMEIQMGRLAQQKGKSVAIKRFGVVLERDHKMGDRKLMALVKSENLALAKISPSPDEAAAMRTLQQARGPDFDRAFAQAMRDDHAKDISALSAAQGRISDQRLKGFIARLIPILKQHEDLAVKLGRA